jgi:Invasion associated locus B (IalB) protein
MTAITRFGKLVSAVLMLLATLALTAQPAFAAKKKAASPKPPPVTSSTGASPKPIGKFKDWTAYSMQDKNGVVCFVVSEPKSKSLSDKKASRGDPFFLVTRWNASQALQPSLIMGYPQAADQKAKVKIGNDGFDMFVQGDGAWMDSEDGDKKLTAAMRGGATVTVTSQSERGTKSTDRYSLAGISDALDKITNDCK